MFEDKDSNKNQSNEEKIAEQKRASMGQTFKDRQLIQQRLADVKHKMMVLSGKGGVGKSTVAVNIAASLAHKGHKVGLLDIDVHGPSIPKLMGLEGHPLDGTENTLYPVKKGDNLNVMSVGFLTQRRDDAIIWRGPLKFSLIRQFLRDVEWGALDYLVIDSPPGTGDEPLTISQLLPDLDGAILVTTPQDLAVEDVRKSISFCRQVNMKILGVVENMSGFICPKCGEVTEIFKTGGGKRMAEEMGVPFLGSIPMDAKIVQASDLGTSFVEHYPKTDTANVFEDIIRPILNLQKKEQEQS
ncbi:MAG: P-loop NTPase [candidate division Zixibacteria bacterium]|nr:P-loop NTPase [candidate division Zixibacteria bacterium]